MPAVAPDRLVRAILDAVVDSGASGVLITPARSNPRCFIVTGSNFNQRLTVYAWTLTFGGRPSLANEFRIQMTSVNSPLSVSTDGVTILIGYEPERELFAGFDLQMHKTFTAGSPSVQIDVEELRRAETQGLSFHRKSNDEIAVGIRPDMFLAYALNARVLHQHGSKANVFGLLNAIVKDDAPIQPRVEEVQATPRQRIVSEVSRLTREASFRRQTLFAYEKRCAVTRTQLRLVEAAHILPVGAPDSADHVCNGIALSPTYHRAFDAGLIYLDENLHMRLNEDRIQLLQSQHLVGGLDNFRMPLGQIFLPPDPNQRPSLDFVQRANKFRQIGI